MSENLITGRAGFISSYVVGSLFEKGLKQAESYFIVVEKIA